MSKADDIVAWFISVTDAGKNIIEAKDSTQKAAQLNAAANSVNAAIASLSTLMSITTPAEFTHSSVISALNKVSALALGADFVNNLIGVYNTGRDKGFDTHDFTLSLSKLLFQSVVAGMVGTATLNPGAAGLAFTLTGFFFDIAFGQSAAIQYLEYLYGGLQNRLKQVHDPIVIDLDDNGIELLALGDAGASTVYFDYDSDGFAERTGWVGPNDGMLALDLNGNGTIDNGSELFGAPTRDGYEVLETYDSYRDGVIDSKDAIFTELKIWRDLDSDGVTDAGELKTLSEMGISSISLTRQDVTGTNAGHDRGFQGSFTRTDGTTGSAETIYFQTDRQDTREDPTPPFTPVEGVDRLPQLSGSGTIHSIAWKASADADFRTAWTALADDVATLSRSELVDRFQTLLLRWAGVDQIDASSRGAYVDGRHLAFVEAFFDDQYRELRTSNSQSVLHTSPTTAGAGAAIEANFAGIVDVLLTMFLAQSVPSAIARGGSFEVALSSPYLAYSLLDFRTELAEGEEASPTPGNLGAVIALLKAAAPLEFGAAVSWFEKGLASLPALTAAAFDGSAQDYRAFVGPLLADIADPTLRQIATEVVKGTALVGGGDHDGLAGDSGANVLSGGHGDDVLLGGTGSDIYTYSRGEGSDWIRDAGDASGDADTLALRDLTRQDVSFGRVGEDLLIKVTSTGEVITIENEFARKSGGVWQGTGVEAVRFSDGTVLSRDEMAREAVYEGYQFGAHIAGDSGNNVLRGSAGNDYFSNIGVGNDVVIFGRGSGFDKIYDGYGAAQGKTIVHLTDLNIEDVDIFFDSTPYTQLVIQIKDTGETLIEDTFTSASAQTLGIEGIRFGNGIEWSAEQIVGYARIRGTDHSETLTDTTAADVLFGKKGNDLIQLLRGGHDKIEWSPGDGSDTIYVAITNTDTDRLVLKNTLQGDVKFSFSGYDLLITHQGTREVIRVEWFVNTTADLTGPHDDPQGSIQEIEFADGTVLDRQGIADKIGADFGGVKKEVHSLVINGFVQYTYLEDEYGNITFVEGVPPVAWDRVSNVGATTPSIHHKGTNNADVLVGGSFSGEGGDDTLRGWRISPDETGDNSLDGGDGNDTLDGGAGDDTLTGGNGCDVLKGGDGADELSGGDGRDFLGGGSGNDTLWGGAGDDELGGYDEDGSDIYVWGVGEGNDVVTEVSGNGDNNIVVLQPASGIDGRPAYEFTRSGDDLIVIATASGETLTIRNQFGSSGPVVHQVGQLSAAQIAQQLVYRGSNGPDKLTGSSLSETFELGRGDDVIEGYGNAGSDTYVYRKGDGNDIIIDKGAGASDIDLLKFPDLAVSEVELARNGDDLLVHVLDTNSYILVRDQFDSIATDGVERIEFKDNFSLSRSEITAAAWFRGSEGRDNINLLSEDYSKTFFLGTGNDTLISGNGSDKVIYLLGDGSDVITDQGTPIADMDVLELKNVSVSDVRLTRGVGYDLTIGFAGNSDAITVEDQFYGTTRRGFEQIRFDDGTVWNSADIRFWSHEGSIFYSGSAANETIVGSYLDQNLSGGDGNDFIDGKAGSDLIFGDAGNDRLSVSTTAVSDVDALDGGLGTDTATFAELSQAVRVDLVADEGLAQIPVSPGTYQTIASLRRIENVEGTSFDDEIAGAGDANGLEGLGGNDLLDGRSGNDVLIGGDGNDILIGGAGDDTLTGSAGSDTYRYFNGDGYDRVIDAAGFAGDALDLSTIVVDRVSLARSGDDLIVRVAPGAPGSADYGEITIVGHFALASAERLQTLALANGVVWTSAELDVAMARPTLRPTIAGTAVAETLSGTSGNDIFRGYGGADIFQSSSGDDVFVYAAGDGNDTISDSGSATNTDVLRFTNINASDIAVARESSHLLIAINATGETIKSEYQFLGSGYGIERVEFGDGTIWSKAQLEAVAWYRGTAGNDTISGLSSNDTFFAKEGNDILKGASGSDVYYFGPGFGNDTISDSGNAGDVDTLKLIDLNQGDVTVERQGYDLLIKVNATGQTLKSEYQFLGSTYGLDRIEFGNGTVWDKTQLTAAAWYRGTAGNDTISGSSSNDTFYGGLGDDRFNSGAGSDTYVYGSGDGNDYINDESGSTTDIDVLKFTDLNASDLTLARLGQHLVVTVNATGHTITLDEQFYSQTSNWGIERFEFADGASWNLSEINTRAWYRGTAGNDTLSGSAWNDTLLGDAGNDSLSGGSGSDVFVFGPGFGKDTITDFVAGAGSADLIEFDDAVFADLSAVLAAATQVGADTLITYDIDNTVTLKNVTKTNLHADDFRFV